MKKINFLKILVIFVKIRTREPGPILGNLYVLILLILDPYLGTWTRTREPGPVLGNFPYSFMYSSPWVQDTQKNTPYLGFFAINVFILIFTLTIDAWLFCHVPWVIGFESGLRNIDFSQRYLVKKLAQYRWLVRYIWQKDFLEPALPLKAGCFAVLEQFNTGHQSYNITK